MKQRDQEFWLRSTVEEQLHDILEQLQKLWPQREVRFLPLLGNHNLLVFNYNLSCSKNKHGSQIKFYCCYVRVGWMVNWMLDTSYVSVEHVHLPIQIRDPFLGHCIQMIDSKNCFGVFSIYALRLQTNQHFQ